MKKLIAVFLMMLLMVTSAELAFAKKKHPTPSPSATPQTTQPVK